MQWLGWIGNIFILIAVICLGRKWTIGWIFSVLGNIVWCWYAITLDMYDILAVDGLCVIMAAYNWWAWSKIKGT
jgi:hypothetical protein